jgi:nucleotide-binding universal stress UspA family protein
MIISSCKKVILIIHGYDSSSSGALFGPAVPRYMSKLKQEAQSYLDKVKEKTKTIGNNRLQLRTEIIESASAVSSIVDFVEKEKADLIIVGTRGRSGFTKLLLECRIFIV